MDSSIKYIKKVHKNKEEPLYILVLKNNFKKMIEIEKQRNFEEIQRFFEEKQRIFDEKQRILEEQKRMIEEDRKIAELQQHSYQLKRINEMGLDELVNSIDFDDKKCTIM